jgi:signal transduction histidine kinase
MAERRGWHRAVGSVRVRITFLATLVFAVAFTVGAILLVRAVRGSLEDRVRDDNRVVLQALADQVEAGASANDVIVPNIAATYQIVGPNGSVVAGDGAIGGRIVTFDAPVGAGEAAFMPAHGTQSQIVGIKSVDAPSGEPFTIAVASPLESVRRSVDTVVRYLEIGIPILVLLVGGLVWLLVRRALRPVEAIREEVEEITHGTLHRRVPVPHAHDEIAALAGTMNHMLDRLEDSAARQREFVSDASHELRSPIAASRTLLEVSGSVPETIDWDALRAELLAENHRMEGLVDGLLELARADRDDHAHTRPVELGDVAADEMSRRRSVPVEWSDIPNVTVDGHSDQLARALRNLLDNAERYAHSRITVSVVATTETVELVVEDDGPGIPAADRTRVFDRFARLEEGRGRDEGGAGLGLAIVAAIAERHHGSARAEESALGGARVVIRLPISEVDAGANRAARSELVLTRPGGAP